MPQTVTCRRCQRELHITRDSTSPWLTCPYCLARVVNPQSLVRRDLPTSSLHREYERDSVDVEVSRDSHGGLIAGILLGVFLLIGGILFISSGGIKMVTASKEGPAVFGIGILVLGSILAGTVFVVSTSKNRVVTAVTGVFGGLLLGAGVIVLLIILFCLGILQTCADMAKPPTH
jgi:amino acid transporter